MKAECIEALLYESEGPTLDFKRDQYAFAKASENEKAELLKDILGFANSWRRTDAFILIGVEETQGGQGIVVGITEHLADHSLQQLVNNLTNRPIQFGYEAHEIDGKQVGVIKIELQRRPIFLKRDYGKLKKGEVYVRRGSSTDPTKPADPDEIAHMGNGQAFRTEEASVIVEFADPDREEPLGDQIDWTAEFCEMPETDEIPNLSVRPATIQLPSGQTFHIPSASSFAFHERLNSRFYHELSNFLFFHKLFKKIRLVVRNAGDVPATDVRLEISVQKDQVSGIVDWPYVPTIPKSRESFPAFSAIEKITSRPLVRHAGSLDIETNEQDIKVEIQCGNLQPGRKVWTEAFYVGIQQSAEVQITGNVFAANLPTPKLFILGIKADVQQSRMTVDDLVSLGEQIDEQADEDE